MNRAERRRVLRAWRKVQKRSIAALTPEQRQLLIEVGILRER